MAALGKAGTVVLDVGAMPARGGSMVLPCPGCTPATTALAFLSGSTPPGKVADELEMDAVYVWAVAEVNQATLHIKGREGYIHGQFILGYCIG